MYTNNLLNGFKAISNEIGLIAGMIFYNKSFVGFIFGTIFSVLIIAFILTKNPRKIPAILRYSTVESFQRFSKRDENGTYLTSYNEFIKIYYQTRMLFFVGLIFILAIITVSLITY